MTAVSVDSKEEVVHISSLAVTNRDFLAVVSAQPETSREQTVQDIIAVGSAAMLRVQTTMDVDFVDKRFHELSTQFEGSLRSFEEESLDSITKKLSPTEAGSYTKYIADTVAEARKDFEKLSAELGKSTKDLLDPEKKGSAVGQLEKLVAETGAAFQRMFDPQIKDSYSSRLEEKLAEVFGGTGRVGLIGAALQDSLRPVVREVQELKEKLEARKVTEELIDSTTLKGAPFEQRVNARLCELAKPFGDDIEAVGSGKGGSRAGDFVADLNGCGRRIVVEARAKRETSLPRIKEEMDRQKAERGADFALHISSGADMLPQHVGDFQIFGDKIVTTFENLHIAYRIARLAVLAEAPDGELDAGALREVIAKAKDAASSLRSVRTKASQVRKLADGINGDAEEAESRLFNLLSDAEGMIS